MYLLLSYFDGSLPDYPNISGYFVSSQTSEHCYSMCWMCGYADRICITIAPQTALYRVTGAFDTENHTSIVLKIHVD